MNKIFTTTLLSLLLINFSIAQNWVSTAPENKNVIFEDFTGIGCGYCPDGHKIIDEVKITPVGFADEEKKSDCNISFFKDILAFR